MVYSILLITGDAGEIVVIKKIERMRDYRNKESRKVALAQYEQHVIQDRDNKKEHTVCCKINSKKHTRGIYSQPLDGVRHPTLFYTMLIFKGLLGKTFLWS